jgi:hypothetical protein
MRKSTIDHIERRFNLGHCRPMQATVVFPEHDLSIEMITRFDFLSQLYSLITNKSLAGDLAQLDVNPEDSFSKYQSPNRRLGAFNSGKWYAKAHTQLCTNFNDWLCPIIYACDETLVVSHLGRASVTPLVFTLSIFNESLRNKRTSWRPLGYIYDMAQHGGKHSMVTTDRKRPRKLKPVEKCSRHHKILQKLKDAGCGHLDVLVVRFCSMDKQHCMTSGSNKAMPRILFKDGVTNLAKLPSLHVVGILLTIVIVSPTDEGISLFEEVFRPVGSKTGGHGAFEQHAIRVLDDAVDWSWLKQDHYWECGDRVEQKWAETAIRTMLEQLIKFWPRGEGNGWFKPKIHNQLHAPQTRQGHLGLPRCVRNSHTSGPRRGTNYLFRASCT